MLTGRGRALAGTALVLYAAGVLLGYQDLIVVAAAALMAWIVGVLWILRRANLEVTREIAPSRVTRGSPAFGEVKIFNPGRLVSAPLRVVEKIASKRISVEVPRLMPGGATTKRYRLPTDRRGLYVVGPVELNRSDPLGLWRRATQVGGFEKLWVHPKVHPLAGMPAGRIKSLDGVDSRRITQGGVAFHALREYQMGDDLRMVHWRSTARTGLLMVRENLETSLPQVTVLLDTRSSVHTEESFEEVVEAAASVIGAAARGLFPVRLITTCGRVGGGRGVVRATSLLDLLADVNISSDVDLDGRVAKMSLERRGDTLVVVSGAPSEEDLIAFGGLARRYDESLICLISLKARRVNVPGGVKARVVRAKGAEEFVQSWNQEVVR